MKVTYGNRKENKKPEKSKYRNGTGMYGRDYVYVKLRPQ